jgi:putative transposase
MSSALSSLNVMTDDLPDAGKCAQGTRDWPHAPPHRLARSGVYVLTARAAEQRGLLGDDSMKDGFQATLFTVAGEFGWTLEA